MQVKVLKAILRLRMAQYTSIYLIVGRIMTDIRGKSAGNRYSMVKTIFKNCGRVELAGFFSHEPFWTAVVCCRGSMRELLAYQLDGEVMAYQGF